MKDKILVAMSGGVDSSVAAGLLLEQGHDIIGVNLRTWEYEPPCNDSNKKSCCSPEDIRDARDVGIVLKIPFYVIKMEKLFEEKVIDRFIQDYSNSLTPNPCVECNTFVKFGALFEKAKTLGIRKIATGHYAQIVETNGRYAIYSGTDKFKNQAYYLYGLSQEALANTIFPLGKMNKEEVRKHARRFNLSVAQKKESQEICFIPENDYRKFLEKKNVTFTPGFLKLTTGEILGKHSGKENFTIGQRKGLGVSHKVPLYVVSIEDDGTVILGAEAETICTEFSVQDVNYQACPPLIKGEETQARVQVRYRHTPVKCQVTGKGDTIHVKLLEKVQSVTPGQSAVFYHSDENYILMGGIIRKFSIVKKTV